MHKIFDANIGFNEDEEMFEYYQMQQKKQQKFVVHTGICQNWNLSELEFVSLLRPKMLCKVEWSRLEVKYHQKF